MWEIRWEWMKVQEWERGCRGREGDEEEVCEYRGKRKKGNGNILVQGK